MPRFRVAEDEKVYLALRTEMYLRVAKMVPAHVASEILRNFGKLEALLHFEGFKQGLAVAELAAAGELTGAVDGLRQISLMNPAMAHAAIYGDADTPLASAEDRWMEKLLAVGDVGALRAGRPWLSTTPVELPPLTLADAVTKYGPDLSVSSPTAPVAAAPEPSMAPTRDPITSPAEALDALIGDDPIGALAAIEMPPDLPPEEIPQESPEFIEWIREALQKSMADGWKPENWTDLILRLHTQMAVDAFWLDIQLSTDVGRAMLAQSGLPHVHPGASVMFDRDFADLG